MSLVEPGQLVRHFLAYPPHDFQAMTIDPGIPAFVARFDLLTTAEPALKRFVSRLPLFRWWQPLLQPRTCFLGTTVTEYAVLPQDVDAELLAHRLIEDQAKRYAFVIVKDLPKQSPLLADAHNEAAARFADALQRRGFVLMEGQALAYVQIDFASIDDYFARLSHSRRKDIRRKLRTRAQLQIDAVPTGDAVFADADLLDRIYALYLNVYAQSEIHFDRLSRSYFAALLQDPTNEGVMFLYRHRGELIGYNLCFVTETALVDKYVGFAYPQARELNLYFVSWIYNLEYALQRGLSHYIAGWTDPQIKAYLGARFTMTRHAVYPRSRILRAVLRRLAGHFESDAAFGTSPNKETDHATSGA